MDGRRIAIVSKGSVFIEDLTASEPKKTETVFIDDHAKRATCVAFGPRARSWRLATTTA